MKRLKKREAHFKKLTQFDCKLKLSCVYSHVSFNAYIKASSERTNFVKTKKHFLCKSSQKIVAINGHLIIFGINKLNGQFS